MKSPRGFALHKCICSGERGDLWLAHEEATGRQVILRSYTGLEAVNAAQTARDRLRELAGPGIPRVIDLLLDSAEPLLVLSAPHGTTLAQYIGRKRDVGTRLYIAAQLAKVLQHLHSKRWVHADLGPSRVLVTEGDPEVLLVDVDQARPPDERDQTRPKGDPLYMAPEQFGRMERGIDSRSDLYSLGATVYHLFTGRPPFKGRDLLELMHAHMARRATPPRDVREEIPPALSAVIMKLLEKEPEDRYQTAQAVHDDLLRCQELCARGEEMPESFALGASDVASRPLFSSRLYGRDSECARLKGALARVHAGGSELWLIRGPSGAGKSALVEELQRRCMPPGWVARGKFDLYQHDQPYLGFRVACETLAQQVLVRGEREIAAWRERVTDGLGANASVLVEWVPEWGFVLGDVPAPPRVEPREAQVRLVRTVMRFLKLVASPEEPLLLFLDDLQWADSGSQLLLNEIVYEVGTPGLLIVGTCRSEDDSSASLLQMVQALGAGPMPVHSIDVPPLPASAMLDMLADAFGAGASDVSGLADVVLKKTENNVFLAQQFIEHMRSLGHIVYRRSEGWQFDLEAISAADISDDAVEVIAARIAGLDPLAQEVLASASFLGDRFELRQVRALVHRTAEDLDGAFRVLADNGLVVPSGTGFRFVHDRIRESAQNLKNEAERRELHYATGLFLLKETPEKHQAAASSEIADHLNRALEIVAPDLHAKVVQLNVWAAQRALEVGAADVARHYVDHAWTLAGSGDLELDPGLSFELDVLRTEVRILSSEYDEADAIACALSKRDLSPTDLARTAVLRMRVCTYMSRERGSWEAEDAERATEIGVEALRKLRAPYPANPGTLRTALGAIRTYFSIRHLGAEDFLRESAKSDERQRAILHIEGAFELVYWVRPNRMLLASACRLRRFREGYAWGFLPDSLVGMGMVFLSGFGRPDIGERFAGIALELIEGRYPAMTPYACAIGAHCLVYGWTRHPSECAKQVEAATHAALEAGDLALASSGGSTVCNLRLQAGEPIAQILQAYDAAEEVAKRAHDRGIARLAHESRSILEWLQSPEPPPPEAAPWHPAKDPSAETVRGFFWSILSAPERAFEGLEQGVPVMSLPDHVIFHRALCALALLPQATRRDARRYARSLRRDRQTLRRRARIGPRNFMHQHLLVEAGYARLRGRLDVALDLASRSVQLSLEGGFPVCAAVALERVADVLFARDRRIDGAGKLRQALDLYRRWGAHAKVAQLEQAHANLLDAVPAHRPYLGRG